MIIKVLSQVFSKSRNLMTGWSTGMVHGIREKLEGRSRLCRQSEAGKSLPAALITLAVGSLLLTPFLSFVSSRSLGSRGAERAFNTQYASDAGVEYAIWSLLNDPTFRAQADSNVSIPQTLAFPGTLNGYSPAISVTALPLGSWTVRQSTLVDVDSGGALAYPGANRVYILNGGGRSYGYYNITTDSWVSLANAPFNVSQGGALVYGGGDFLYALEGGNSKGFWRYNTNTNNWIAMKDAPKKVKQGGDLVYTGGGKIYAFLGNSNQFWMYSAGDDDWTRQANAPNKVRFGSDLVYTGGKNIYALRGNSSEFWHYDIDNDSWSTRQNTPAKVSAGGGLAYHSGSYIYGMEGGSNAFWRYTISSDSWTVLTPAPAKVSQGSDLIFTTATTGFATRGSKSTEFWEFEVTPPRYDIQAVSGSVTIDARIEINGNPISILFWDFN